MRYAAPSYLLFIALIFTSPVLSAEEPPSAVKVARATAIPDCTSFVDAAASGEADGSIDKPYATIGAALEAAKPGAVICVAEGSYAEALKPGDKHFTLAGGFQSGKAFKVRDSAAYVSKAAGKGGSFLRVEDPAPSGEKLTAIDGFEISGYSQAIVRDFYESQRFEVTNNFIHDNICADQSLVGAGVALANVSGLIKGNVFRNNACGRGGAIFLNDPVNQNTVSIENNLIDGNSGTEPDSAHGGAVYLFGNTLSVIGNEFINNSVTHWGAGLYIGAYRPGNQPTTATQAWNVYRGNRAGNSGGGSFCDDGATCKSAHEVYDGNCGGNILVDGGPEGSGPNVASYDHLTSVGALAPGCDSPGAGIFINTYEAVAEDRYSVTNAIFWGNAPGGDIVTACDRGCDVIKMSVAYSLVQTDYKDGNIKVEFGDGIVAPSDPLFVDAKAGDFRLQAGSPAIGKGNPPGTDLGALPIGTPPRSAAGDSGTPQSGPDVAQSETPPEKPPVSAPAETAPEPAEAKQSAEAEEPAQAEESPAETAAAPAPVASKDNVPAKQAFDDARELGTVQAWNAFLSNYPSGFYADLARAYLEKLGVSAPAQEAPSKADVAPPPPKEQDAKSTDAPAPAEATSQPGASRPSPAVTRGGDYMGFPEKFNRYYTDPSWKPSKTIFVSPDGGGDGASRSSPTSAAEAVAAARPGTEIVFLRGKYTGCFEFTKENGGTYDEPVLLRAERNDDGSVGVSVACCDSGRKTCFNFEAADYVALDGFELAAGVYGVRAVGAGYAASEHSRGLAILGCVAHDQDKEPFFSGQSDWNVWEGNVASGAKKGDGHGIYISNGSDWNVVRFNETFGNVSSDFQINASPLEMCTEEGIALDDPQCDAFAGEGEGGRGASDFFLVDGNYFHHGLAQGPNFTSVRRSVVRNNVFGPQARHNTSFWQETDNPKLGSSENKILHNLFVTTGRHGVKFERNSTNNEFANNVIVGVEIDGDAAKANPKALLMDVDDTAGGNIYRDNLYVSGFLEGREPNKDETAIEEFSPAWFKDFPLSLNHDADAYTPTAEAPFLGKGSLLPDAPLDRNGVTRKDPTDLGPIVSP